MDLYQIRKRVLDSKSDTLMAQRFREAFGIRSYQERNAYTITKGDWVRRERKRMLYECMDQRYGALDRSGKQ